MKLKALFFLSLFLFSTIGTYASVHQCEGEITDVAVLSVASCDHEMLSDMHCKWQCCKKEQKNNESHDDNCCSTLQVTVVKNKMTQTAKVDLQLISKVLPSFYDFYFEHPKVLYGTSALAYSSPPIEREVRIEVQSFQI